MFYNDVDRRKWQNPEKILYDLGLNYGLTFIDVGCGNGYFLFPAAEIVGEDGKVYGLDINKKAMAKLNDKVIKKGLKNVILKTGRAEEKIFCNECADFVFLSIVLHDFNDPLKVLINARKMLKPSGKLVNLDWKKESMRLGPPLSIRFSKEKAIKLIREADFKLEKTRTSSYHYTIIATVK